MHRDTSNESGSGAAAAERSALHAIPIECIHRSPYRALAPAPGPAAIATWRGTGEQHGVLVRPRILGGYELLVGEFAWRLAQAARGETLWARVLELPDEGLAQQLATLDAQQDAERIPGAPAHPGQLPWCSGAKLTIARTIRTLRTEQHWSLTAAASAFGLSRAEGAHYVRVLTLPAPVLALIDQGALSFGQARALARLAHWPEHARLLALKVAALPGTPARGRRRPHSVREVERLVAETLQHCDDDALTGDIAGDARAGHTGVAAGATRHASSDLARTERILSERCGFPVQIDFDPRSRGGRLVVRFASVDEFQTVAERLAPGIDFENE